MQQRDSSSQTSAIAQLSLRSALSRRQAMIGAAALGGIAALGARPAFAKTTMTWMGWQGYETPILSGTFIADNDIDFQPTFISSNEEIITKLQAGGIGNTDLITMYFGYLPLMAEGGLLEPIDTAQIDQLPKLIPQFLAQDAIKHVEVLEYPELGMEAIWKIEVEDFPAFIITDEKGNDFFTDLL